MTLSRHPGGFVRVIEIDTPQRNRSMKDLGMLKIHAEILEQLLTAQ